MNRIVLALILVVAIPGAVPSQTSELKQAATKQIRQEPPADFKGDGCSLFPDRDYADCCLAHDRDYYRGGTKEERKASDKRLAQCVRAKGHKYLSRLMYVGVRIGGMAWLPTPFRWGFGQKKKDK